MSRVRGNRRRCRPSRYARYVPDDDQVHHRCNHHGHDAKERSDMVGRVDYSQDRPDDNEKTAAADQQALSPCRNGLRATMTIGMLEIGWPLADAHAHEDDCRSDDVLAAVDS